MDVQLTKSKLFGDWFYQVWVDYEVYEKFISKYNMTDSEMVDVANGYREALDVLL